MALEETKLKIGKNKRSWFYTEERVEKWNSSPEVVLDAWGMHRFKETPDKYLRNKSIEN